MTSVTDIVPWRPSTLRTPVSIPGGSVDVQKSCVVLRSVTVLRRTVQGPWAARLHLWDKPTCGSASSCIKSVVHSWSSEGPEGRSSPTNLIHSNPTDIFQDFELLEFTLLNMWSISFHSSMANLISRCRLETDRLKLQSWR